MKANKAKKENSLLSYLLFESNPAARRMSADGSTDRSVDHLNPNVSHTVDHHRCCNLLAVDDAPHDDDLTLRHSEGNVHL
jgi:hypothetical protein